MNKFITLALFAICATMAHGQVFFPGTYGTNAGLLSNGHSDSSASANANARSSSDLSSTALNGANINFAGPLAPLAASYGGPLIAGVPQGLFPSIASPYLQSGYSVGPSVLSPSVLSPVVGPVVGPLAPFPVGPCGQGIYAL